MRTTLTIDDNLLAKAKAGARSLGITLGQLVENALRRELAESGARDAPPVPVFRGGGGPRAGVELRSNRALAELLDPVGRDRPRR